MLFRPLSLDPYWHVDQFHIQVMRLLFMHYGHEPTQFQVLDPHGHVFGGMCIKCGLGLVIEKPPSWNSLTEYVRETKS